MIFYISFIVYKIFYFEVNIFCKKLFIFIFLVDVYFWNLFFLKIVNVWFIFDKEFFIINIFNVCYIFYVCVIVIGFSNFVIFWDFI